MKESLFFIVFTFTFVFLPYDISAQNTVKRSPKGKVDTTEQCAICVTSYSSVEEFQSDGLSLKLGCSGLIMYMPFEYIKLKDTIRLVINKEPDSLFIHKSAAPPYGMLFVDLSNIVTTDSVCVFPILGKYILNEDEKKLSARIKKELGVTNPNISYAEVTEFLAWYEERKNQHIRVYILFKTIP